MILDAQNQFSDEQALTATAGSENVLDLGVAANIGDGEPVAAVVYCDVALGGTTPTLDIAVQTDSVEAFSSPTAVASAAQLSSMAAGDRVIIPIPVGVEAERYLRLNYTLGGTSPTVTLSAFLVPQSSIDKFRTYNDNVTIS